MTNPTARKLSNAQRNALVSLNAAGGEIKTSAFKCNTITRKWLTTNGMIGFYSGMVAISNAGRIAIGVAAVEIVINTPTYTAAQIEAMRTLRTAEESGSYVVKSAATRSFTGIDGKMVYQVSREVAGELAVMGMVVSKGLFAVEATRKGKNEFVELTSPQA